MNNRHIVARGRDLAPDIASTGSLVSNVSDDGGEAVGISASVVMSLISTEGEGKIASVVVSMIFTVWQASGDGMGIGPGDTGSTCGRIGTVPWSVSSLASSASASIIIFT